MYLGHSFLAFAIVATAGYLLEFDRRRVFVLAALAAGYGLLPDVDMWRTVYVFLREGPDGVFPTEQHLWQHSWVVHRALTHSILTGTLAALASGLVVRTLTTHSKRLRALTAVGVFAAASGLLWGGHDSAGVTGLATVALFLGGAVGLAFAGHRRGISAVDVFAAACVGLLTHPFGDFWMGRPPAFLAPAVSEPPLGEFFLSADPVLHFLAAVGIEIVLLSACIHLISVLYGRATVEYVSPLSLLGIGALASLGRVPAPTFAEAYQFSGGLFVLAFVVVIAVGALHRKTEHGHVRAFVSGVAAFGVGLLAYAVGYVTI